MLKWIIFIFPFILFSFACRAQFDVDPESVAKNSEVKRIFREAFCPSNIPKEHRKYGKALLIFVIRKDGSTDGLRFAKGINLETDKEIERVFPMVQWLPGIIDTVKVDAEHLFQLKVKPDFYTDSALCMAGPFEKPVPYEEVDQKPMFLLGKIDKWIYKNLEYPQFALKNGIQGTVMTRFVVEKNGRLSNIAVSRSIGGGCDEEALRVVSKTKWKPGKIDGEPVRTQIYYPITFQTGTDRFIQNSSGDMIRGH